MASQSLTSRLESLYRHLSEEGWHVHANTLALAMDQLEKKRRGRPPTNFDKRAYQRLYMADKRQAEKIGVSVREYRETVKNGR